MKGLATLIRVRREALDGRRRRLAALESQRVRIDRSLDELAERERSERALAGGDPLLMSMFQGFLRYVAAERAGLLQRRETLLRDIDRATEEIAEAFRELKKFEIAKDRHDRRRAAEAARLERLELDEIGLNAFRRRRAESVEG